MNVEEKNLDEIERLLTQSMRGIHHLFDNDKIARILQIPTESMDFFNYDNMDRIQDLFTELINRETLEEKKLFLNSLDPGDYEILLRTYFHIVDNTLLASSTEKH